MVCILSRVRGRLSLERDSGLYSGIFGFSTVLPEKQPKKAVHVPLSVLAFNLVESPLGLAVLARGVTT
jgi:hypothetical protein